MRGKFLVFILFANCFFHLPAQASSQSKLIDLTRNLMGRPYQWGASGPNAFDCSGFFYYVLKMSSPGNFNLPYQLSGMPGYTHQSLYYRDYLQRARAQISCDKTSLGDIVFFPQTGTDPNHIGIITNPETSEFVTAQNRQVGVSAYYFGPRTYWQAKGPSCYRNIWVR